MKHIGNTNKWMSILLLVLTFSFVLTTISCRKSEKSADTQKADAQSPAVEPDTNTGKKSVIDTQTVNAKSPLDPLGSYCLLDFTKQNITYLRGASMQEGMLVLSNDTDTVKSFIKIPIPVDETFPVAPGNTFYIVCEVKVSGALNRGDGVNRNTPSIVIDEDGKSPIWHSIDLTAQHEDEWVQVVEQYTLSNKAKMVNLELRLSKTIGTFTCRKILLAENLDFTDISPEYVYPFELPEERTCIMEINTNHATPFNNALLGVNSPLNTSRGRDAYADPNVQLAIKSSQVSSIRFPGGTIANWYDYETDGYSCPDFYKWSDEKQKSSPYIIDGINEGLTFQYKDFLKLAHLNKFSMVEVFNVLYDSPEKNVARLKQREADGLVPIWIELGNENWSDKQMGGNISNVQDYISVTKEITKALKSYNSNTKIAICVNDPDGSDFFDDKWNKAFIGENYFDAVAIHPYIRALRLFMFDEYFQRRVAGAYGVMKAKLEKCHQSFPDKKVLVTEYAVKSDGNENVLFDSMMNVIGDAASWFAIFDKAKEGIVDSAFAHRLFETGDKRNGLFVSSAAGMQKRQRGVLYELLWDTLKDSKVLDSKVNSPLIKDIYNVEFNAMPAVHAMAVEKDGKISILCVNTLPVPVTLQLPSDNSSAGIYTIKSYSDSMFTMDLYALDEQPKSLTTTTGSGDLAIGAFSINVINLH